MTSGYYRFPSIHQDTIVFVAEDDLWTVARSGGIARRLTSNLGEVNYPALSPDGAWLAFVGREEGMPEVFLMPAAGGSARRMTYLNSRSQVLGWTPDSAAILLASNHAHFDRDAQSVYRLAPATRNGAVELVPVGLARSIAYGPAGQVVIGRNTGDAARWKRYRGGTAGHLWIDRMGDGAFERFLPDLKGNIASPMWLEVDGLPRVFFVSDHEGIGNLYSATPAGDDQRRHTDHADFYARNPSTDGRRIVYHAGADLYVYDPATATSEAVTVATHSPRVQRNRRFAWAATYLDHARLNPTGDALAITTRGKAFAFYNHEGPVIQVGKREGVRHRLIDWLNDDQRLVYVDDAAGEEELVIYDADPESEPKRLAGLDIGRPAALRVSPKADKLALSNHRNELLIVDLEQGTTSLVDHSAWRPIAGFDWSPDGQWLAYGFATSVTTTEIRLYHLPEPMASAGADAGKTTNGENPTEHDTRNTFPTPPIAITLPILHDMAPAFDPGGKYLYFLSHREFNPVYDNLQFDLGFPWGMRPYLITLQAELPNPFMPQPGGAEETHDAHEEEEDDEDDEDDEDEDNEHGDEGDEGEGDEGEGNEEDAGIDADARRSGRMRGQQGEPTLNVISPTDAAVPAAGEKPAGNTKKKDRKSKPLVIDLEGIQERVLPFPVADSRYGQIAGAPGRAIFTVLPLHGALDSEHDMEEEEPESGTLRAWVFKDFKAETIVENVNAFELARNRKKLLYLSGKRVRVISASEKAPSEHGPGRKTGWVDLGRVKLSVEPQSEWEQMYREAWRLQRDHFWAEDMAEVDWSVVYTRYFPLIERVSTRSEFSDLVWEMQGELGTSHAYEFGGDYRPAPHYNQGVLGADLTWDATAGGYRVGDILLGDAWRLKANSPLRMPGVDIRTGDVLTAINGQRLDADVSPAQLLVNQAHSEVLLTRLLRPDERDKKTPSAAGDAPAATDKPAPRIRSYIVKTIASNMEARYRAWVEANRRRVYAASDGRMGYLHIPDMGARGYAEFHRGFLAEVARDGLIVDVRYNGGGHVSQLLLEKLARRRIGYDQSRWGGISPYPSESVAGPVVAITNEHAGSDGDIFCHSFKLLKLGPLIGKRTWGGVIGISPRNPLVDGTITTQPEFSFWFEDVGWTVENYGTDPDIEVDITPQDYVAGRDPQLERALVEALRLLAEKPILKPDLATRPSRALPQLPRRT